MMLENQEIKGRESHNIAIVLELPKGMTDYIQILMNHIQIPYDYHLKTILVRVGNSFCNAMIYINGKKIPEEIYVVGGTQEVFTCQCVADVGGSLNNKYWEFQAIAPNGTKTNYYVWYNVSSGGTDPSLSGKTGIEVAISTNDTADAVATATKNAIDSLDWITATVSTDTVTVTLDMNGDVTDASDTGSSGFTIGVTTQGVTYNGEQVNEDGVNLAGLFTASTSGLYTEYPIERYLTKNWDIEVKGINLGTDPYQVWIWFIGDKLFLKTDTNKINDGCPET